MIGQRLARARGEASQVDFATRLGVHKNTYARWERDERQPDADALARLVAEGWNANWLLTGEGPERLSQLRVAESLPAYGSQDLSESDLSLAVEYADTALAGLDHDLIPRPLYARLLKLLYDGLTKGLPLADVRGIAQETASAMKRRLGGSDDGESAVARAGKGGR